jgi:hypothetical protein
MIFAKEKNSVESSGSKIIVFLKKAITNDLMIYI